MVWKRREQLSFVGIGLSLAAFVVLSRFVVHLRENVRDVGSFVLDTVTDPLAVCLYAFLLITIAVCWDRIRPWLPWLERAHPAEKSIQLEITFDATDPKCNDIIGVTGQHVYRVRLVNASRSRTAHNAAIRVVGFRRLLGETPKYLSSHVLDKFLDPLMHDGPRFEVHAQGRELVNVVRISTHNEEPPGWMYLCDVPESVDCGIEAGRYVITMRAEGQNCTPDEQQFYIELNEEEFVLEPFHGGKRAEQTGRRLVEKHRATERWRKRNRSRVSD